MRTKQHPDTNKRRVVCIKLNLGCGKDIKKGILIFLWIIATSSIYFYIKVSEIIREYGMDMILSYFK